MFCQHCGAKNQDQAHFCTECGNKLLNAPLAIEKHSNSEIEDPNKKVRCKKCNELISSYLMMPDGLCANCNKQEVKQKKERSILDSQAVNDGSQKSEQQKNIVVKVSQEAQRPLPTGQLQRRFSRSRKLGLFLVIWPFAGLFSILVLYAIARFVVNSIVSAST